MNSITSNFNIYSKRKFLSYSFKCFKGRWELRDFFNIALFGNGNFVSIVWFPDPGRSEFFDQVGSYITDPNPECEINGNFFSN